MTDSNEKGKVIQWVIFLLVFIALIFAVLIFCGSFGKIDFISSVEKKLINDNKWIERRIIKLEFLKLSKSELKRNLDKQVNVFFLIFRITSVSIFLIIDTAVYINCGGNGFFERIDRVMNINQLLLVLIILGSFLLTNKLADISFMIRIVHLKIKKIVYGKYKNLDEDVKNIEIEILDLNIKKQENIKQLEKIRQDKNKKDEFQYEPESSHSFLIIEKQKDNNSN